MGVDDWSDDVFYLSVSRDNRVNRANTDELMSGKICTVTSWIKIYLISKQIPKRIGK